MINLNIDQKKEIILSPFNKFKNIIDNMNDKQIIDLFTDVNLMNLSDCLYIIKDNMQYIVWKENILKKLLFINESLIHYLNYYFGLINIVNEELAIKLCDYYYNKNIKIIKRIMPFIGITKRIELYKKYDFTINELKYLGLNTQKEVLEYLFSINPKITSLAIYSYSDIKSLINSNYNIPKVFLYEKKFVDKISTIENVKDYRLFMDNFQSKYDSSYIENVRKKYYEKEIVSYNPEKKLLIRYANFMIEIEKNPNFELVIDKYFNFYNSDDDPLKKIILNFCLKKDFNGLKEFLILESNYRLTNMIIDYHFEDIPYNFFMDLKRLLKFQETEGRTLTGEEIELYNLIINLDNLSYEDKLKLHEKLKNINIMEKYYDNYHLAKNSNALLIKKYMLTEDKLKNYYKEDVSIKLGVPVYVLDGEPFYALIKSLEIKKSEILKHNDLVSYVDGASFSLDGSIKLKTFYDPRINYNIIYGDFPLNQLVHIYPVDSYSHYKRDTGYLATTRVFEFCTPKRLLEWGLDHNEIIISEHNSKRHDELNENLEVPIPLGIYCYDVITENDIISSQKTGLPIVVVKTKNYPLEKDDSKLNEYATVGLIFGYQKEYDYITLEREDDMFLKRKI